MNVDAKGVQGRGHLRKWLHRWADVFLVVIFRLSWLEGGRAAQGPRVLHPQAIVHALHLLVILSCWAARMPEQQQQLLLPVLDSELLLSRLQWSPI